MPGRKARVVIIFSLALLILQTKEPLAAADRILKVPFEYASGRDSILVPVRINDKPTLLIFDTGSAHTVLCPELVGLSPKDLKTAQTAADGAGFMGDAVGKEVLLQVGNLKWQKRRVAIMDLSQVFSVYHERVGGVLGLDFVREFRETTINVKEKTITFIY